jgi:DHA1 family tetracycline resistance protein-like MFS transporter
MSAPTAVDPPRKAAVLFILVTVLLDMLSFGIIIPVLPKLVEEFLGGDTAQAAIIYGLMGTAWALMQFVCSPIQGALSDRFGRRPVVLLSNFGLGLDYIVMALAPNVIWLVIGRTISGIASSSFSTAGAYIADVTPVEQRAAAYGKIGMVFGLGFVFGPAMGGWLGAFDPRWPFWGAAALSLLNACYGYFVLPESLPEQRRMAFAWRRANPVGSLVLLRSHHELFGLAAVAFLGYLAHAVLPSTSVLYMGYRYGWGPAAVGLMMAGVGVAAMIVQGGLIRPITARFGERTTLLAGSLSGAAGFFTGHGVLGIGGPGDAGADEPPCECVGAGPASRRNREHQRSDRLDRSVVVHSGVCLFHRTRGVVARARCTLCLGLAAARSRGGDRLAND